MTNFKNRKFLLLLMLALLIFTARVFLPLDAWLVAVIAAALGAVFFALGGGFSKKTGSIIFAVFTLAFSLLPLIYGAAVASRSEKSLNFITGETQEASATVTEVRFGSAYASSYAVEINEIEGKKVSFGAVLELMCGSSFEYGDIIRFSGTFSAAGEEYANLRGENIFVLATADDAVRTGKNEKDFLHTLAEINDSVAKRFTSFMGKETGGLCAALVLGNKRYVDAGLKLDFSRAGISHLLALSGLHLSVLAGALDFVLRGFIKKKPRGVILILSCFAFAVFTGLSASVFRAAVMLAFVFAADIFGEENDSLTALFAAVWVILIVNGNSVYDVGFALSVSATLGIILVRPACEELFAKWKKPRKNLFAKAARAAAKYFYGVFTMSAAAIIFTLPIIGFAFGEVSLAGVFSNFVFLPLASVLMVLCALFIPFSYIPLLGSAFSSLCGGISSAVILLAQGVSDIRGVSLSLLYPFVPVLLIILSFVLFACIFIKRLTLIKMGAGLLAFALSFAVSFGVYSCITAGDMLVCIGSEKSGEYVAFSADGENYVLDISTGGYDFVGDALESRKSFCETEIDNLVLTHYHNHHASALFRLCERVKIRKVLLPAPETEGEQSDFDYIAQTLGAAGVEYELYARGEVYENGDVRISFAPMRKLGRSEKPLVAFTAECGAFSFSYIEGVALESNFDYGGHLSAQAVFIGAHGPARKFKTSAEVLGGAAKVIFAEDEMEFFRGIEYLAETYSISAYGGKMRILYDN